MIAILKKGASQKDMNEIHAKFRTRKGVYTKKYCGTIKLNKDPLIIQKQILREWNNR